MRSLVTALNLVLPEGIDEPSDDDIVRMVERELSKVSIEETSRKIRDLVNASKIPFMTTIQVAQPGYLHRYSAKDAELSAKFLKAQLEDPICCRMLKQRGVRPVMMVHDEMYLDLEMTQDQLKKKREDYLK